MIGLLSVGCQELETEEAPKNEATSVELPTPTQDTQPEPTVKPTPRVGEQTLQVLEDNDLEGELTANLDGVSFEMTSPPSKGEVVLSGNKFTYSPRENENGPDSFDYVAILNGVRSTPAKIHVDIQPVADDLVFSALSKTTQEDTPIEFDLDVINVDGIPLDSVGQKYGHRAQKGFFEKLNDEGRMRYTPSANENGVDDFVIIVEGHEISVSITIEAVNDQPTAESSSKRVQKNAIELLTLRGEDVETNEVTITVTKQPTNGTLTLASGKYTYRPNTDYLGQDTVEYTVSDGTLTSEVATINLEVYEPEAGEIDKTYGRMGISHHRPEQTGVDQALDRWARDLRVLDNDKTVILARGRSYYPQVELQRYNKDGSLDTSFGQSGTLVVDSPYDPNWTSPRTLEVLSDGDLLIGCESYAVVCLLRLRADGDKETSFGVNGLVTLDKDMILPDAEWAHIDDIKTTVDEDGNIYARFTLAGERARLLENGVSVIDDVYMWGMVKLDSTGSLVTSRADNGIFLREGQGYKYGPLAIQKLQYSSHLIALHHDDEICTLERFSLSTGAADTSFGVAGLASLPKVIDGRCMALKVDAQGSIFVGGSSERYLAGKYERGFRLVKLKSWGALDLYFGGTGDVFTSFMENQDETILDLEFANGGIIAVGQYDYARYSEGHGFSLVKYQYYGNLDPNFGDGGVVNLPIKRESASYGDSRYSRAIGLEIQSDGNILVGGTLMDTNPQSRWPINTLGIVRYIGK